MIEQPITPFDLDAIPEAKEGELRKSSNIPRDAYEFRIKDEPEMKESAAGNAMLVYKLEQVSPAELIDQQTGERTTPVGLEYTFWAAFTDRGNRNLKELHAACVPQIPTKGFGLKGEVPILQGADGSISQIKYAGAKLFAVAESELRDRTKKNATGEEEPIINPHTNKPMQVGNRRIVSLCLPD